SRRDYDQRTAIARFVGRQFDVWGLVNKQRRLLIAAAPASALEAGRWAELVALTHSRSREVLEPIARVPDVALPPLLAAAARHRLQGLIEMTQAITMQRVNRGEATS